MGDYNRFNDEPLDDEISLVGGIEAHSELGEDLYLAGKSMYELGQYVKARPNLEGALKYGKTEAAYYLGELYYSGLGTERDYARAYGYYQRAQNIGIADVYYKLGRMSLDGNGTAEDYAKAKEYLLKAIEMDSVMALTDLGWLYERENNYDEAVRYYKLAAEKGRTVAMYNLGNLYWFGRGVEENEAEAFRYYSMAESDESIERLYRLGWMYKNGRGTEINYAKAHEYLHRALATESDNEQYQSYALNCLGILCENGQGCTKNMKKAAALYIAGAMLGNEAAMYNLALLYESGDDDVEQNLYIAYMMYKEAADLGDKDAKRKLADGKWDEYKLN